MSQPAQCPVLSVVVIGRNEGQRLRRCLESVGCLTSLGGEIEIIYVDSASNDGSPGLALSAGAKVLVLDTERTTAALGRNTGLEAARASYILFLDGDTILRSDFPKRALAVLAQDDSIAAVWGHRREIHPDHSLYNRILDLDWIYPAGDTEFCGGDVLMRKRALEEVHGFDSTLIAGEEPELCRRLRERRYRIVHIDCPMTGHDLQMTSFNQYWKRAVRAGHAYAEVSDRFQATADPFWTAESRANLLRGSFWILSLVLALIAIPFTPWLLLAWVALLFVLALRSAWKNRWKMPGKAGLLLTYGLHSHLQQIPIVLGQLAYLRDRHKGTHRKLIEYKEGTEA